MAQKCLSFDGIDDYANCGNDQSLNLTDALSMEIWVYPTALPAGQHVIDKFYATGYILKFRGSDIQPCFGFESGYHNEFALGVMTTDEWQYIAVTWSKSSGYIKIYRNGVEESSNGGFTESIIGNANELLIGIYHNKQLIPFAGKIDEVRISNKARTQAEIEAIWNGGNGVQFEVDANTVALWHMNEGANSTIYDETENDNDGTITGASWADGYDFLTSCPTSSDAGSGIDASTLSEVFFSADSGVGLGALAALLAVINTSEVSSGCDRLRAKIESATTGGDMKLPPGGQASIPSRKVGI